MTFRYRLSLLLLSLSVVGTALSVAAATRKTFTVSTVVTPIVTSADRTKFTSARVFCEQPIRFWSTPGADPAADAGIILYSSGMMPLTDIGQIQNFKMIRKDAVDAVCAVELFP